MDLRCVFADDCGDCSRETDCDLVDGKHFLNVMMVRMFPSYLFAMMKKIVTIALMKIAVTF